MRIQAFQIMSCAIVLAACGVSAPQARQTTEPMPTVTPTIAAVSGPRGPRSELRLSLEAIGREFGAAQSGADLRSMKQHAQSALNILVGPFGRWYAGDGAEAQGVLPGERIPGPAPDVGTPVFPRGLLVLIYSDGTDAERKAIRDLTGEIEQWNASPRKGYDEVAAAISTGAPPLHSVAKLAGPVPRMVAYARLITLASSTADASTLAGKALTDAQDAVTIANTLGR